MLAYLRDLVIGKAAETGGVPATETGGVPATETGGVPATETGGVPATDKAKDPEGVTYKDGYRCVKIQTMELKASVVASSYSARRFWSNYATKGKGKSKEKETKEEDEQQRTRNNMVFYAETCRESVEGAFWQAFRMAYNDHKELILVPDDIWLMIALQFAKHVNAHADELKDRIVNSTCDKTALQVTVHGNDWLKMLEAFANEIVGHTKGPIQDTLLASFTTTWPVNAALSAATVMDSCKSYFKYECFMYGCGITGVRFKGTLQDWQNLLSRLISLVRYDTRDGNWSKFVQRLVPVLDQFIATYRGNVDVTFWNQILHEERRNEGSGGQVFSYVKGWLLAFYHMDTNTEGVQFNALIDPAISGLPIQIAFPPLQPELRPYVLYGGFSGVHHDAGAFRPHSSLAIFSV